MYQDGRPINLFLHVVYNFVLAIGHIWPSASCSKNTTQFVIFCLPYSNYHFQCMSPQHTLSTNPIS